MTAVQSPVSALHDSFNRLTIDSGLPGGPRTITKRQLTEEEKQAKIYGTSYEPSIEWWTANNKSHIKPADDPLPDGFPEQDNSSSAWDGKVLINQPEKWLYRFTVDDIALLETAYKYFVSLSLTKNDISRETFPIPIDSTLYKELRKSEYEINHGVGLRVLRGLPVDDWEREQQLIIFAGISAYVGDRRIKQGIQNVVHLRDITTLDVDKRPAITVKGQTSGNQVFHNDGSVGIVGLITVGVAENGGLSQLSSVANTYNQLARTRRDIIRELAKGDWVTKQFPEGKPLFFAHENRVISSYSRRPFFGFYEADPDVPTLAKEKHLALDAVHFTAEKYSLDLDLQKGDLEYFNNLTVYHARTASTDSDKNARHLIRIWLENKGQPLPAELRALYAKINAGQGKTWPLEAWDTNPYLPTESAEEEEKKEEEGASYD
ncbi:taurine catabolism dioxygenase TauD [Cryptococcus neoformans Bt1]|nr:taurine catabolism dioxygenase TauD [Cryptococcus neoformans var. grubii Bt1]